MDFKKDFENKRKKFISKIDKVNNDKRYTANYNNETRGQKDYSFLNSMKTASITYAERFMEDTYDHKVIKVSNPNLEIESPEVLSPDIPRFNSPEVSDQEEADEKTQQQPTDNSNYKVHSKNYNIFKNLPNDIESISKLEESSIMKTFNFDEKVQKEKKYEELYINRLEPIEFSITKENQYHLDENQDINFIKDLSSFSRKTYSLDDEKDINKKYDLNKLAFEMINPEFHEMEKNLIDPSDLMCIDIAANQISDDTLNKIIKNVPIGRIKQEALGSEKRIQIDTEEESKKKIEGVSIAVGLEKAEEDELEKQARMKTELDFDNINTITVLHNIINLKSLKKPLTELPENFDMIKGIKENIINKMVHQLNCLCKQIIGKNAPDFERNVKFIVSNVETFKNQYVQGVNKTRLLKVLLNEVLALRASNKDFLKNLDLG